MRYRLRTLMIVLAVGPPKLAAMWLYRDKNAIVLFGVWAIVAGVAAVLAVEFFGALAGKGSKKEANR